MHRWLIRFANLRIRHRLCRRYVTYSNGDTAFNIERLEKAIRIREGCYRLLTWLSKAIADGTAFPGPTRHSGSAEAAAELIRGNIYFAPEALLPSPDDAEEFSAFFGTFLTSTFDVVEKPGTQGIGPSGCGCDICVRIVNAPHLQPKKLYAKDKRRARELMVRFLSSFSCERDFQLNENQLQQVVEANERDVALMTYCHWLILRLTGESDGPAVLVLWRMISRSAKGGLLRDFELSTVEFESAAERVLAAVRRVPTA